ncbi:MAG: hypothetical protein U1E36_09410 [Rickettsiales bacterium]
MRTESSQVPARLKYVTDVKPGITRKKAGKSYQYFDAHGKRITNEEELKRIRSLAVPPAYKNVWISPWPNGHIQATGLDQKGRKQYRYHPRWRELRDETKFSHILQFGERLPSIRARIEKDMKLQGLERNKVLATVVQLLEKTLIRVGNAEYAKKNQSYGLTTIRKKHVAVKGGEIRFKFKGKSGKEWNLSLHDRRIASVVKKCAEVQGFELFKYIDDDGKVRDVTSSDVNAYLKEISGEDFTAKDFRTWAGTVLAALALVEYEKYDSAAQAKKNIVKAVETVAKQLGNTPAICRKCYIHPEIISSYSDGNFYEMVEHEIDEAFRKQYKSLSREEVMVLAFLKKRIS